MKRKLRMQMIETGVIGSYATKPKPESDYHSWFTHVALRYKQIRDARLERKKEAALAAGQRQVDAFKDPVNVQIRESKKEKENEKIIISNDPRDL